MTGDKDEARQEGLQNPLIHEGAAADPVEDTNERADDAADIRQPDGDSPVPRD